MTELEKCPMCSGPTERVTSTRTIQVGRRSLDVEIEHDRCTKCAETFYTPDAIEVAQLKAANQVREEDGLLHPDEIKALRGNLNLSQVELEKLLGLGEKSIVRWERGYVFQSKAADMLLRLVRDVPGVVPALATYNGVSSEISPYSTPVMVGVAGGSTRQIVAPKDLTSRFKASRAKAAMAKGEYVTTKGQKPKLGNSASREAIYREGIG